LEWILKIQSKNILERSALSEAIAKYHALIKAMGGLQKEANAFFSKGSYSLPETIANLP
jgi:hypothetical protein